MADDSNPVIGDLHAKDFYVEAGNTGLKVFGGYVVEEFEPNLRGMRGARMLREMQDTDPTVGAILFVIGQCIRKIQWHLQPADQTVPSLLAQEFFESCIIDMNHTWEDFIAELLSMFTYGYAPFEIVLKERKGKNPGDATKDSRFNDGMIGIRKLALRGQDTVLRWIMDADNNDVLGLVQMPWTGGIRTIPAEKLIMFRTISTKNNPEGRSLLRNAYRPYYFRKRMEEIEAIGVERDLAGLPIMRIPAEVIAAAASGNDTQAAMTVAAYKKMVVNIRRNTQEGLVLPSDRDAHGNLLFDLALLSSGGARQFQTSTIIDRYTQLIATTVMADFLLLGHSGRGGGAQMGVSKIDMFYSSIEGMVQAIASTLNTQLVPLLGDLNGIPEKYWPTFFADKAEQVDIGKLGAYINALAASGMQLFPDAQLESYLRDVAGLPDVSDETQQNNEQMNHVNQAADIHAKVSSMAPPPPQMGAPGGIPGKPPPQQMGGGGGNPNRPQGQFGAPRGTMARPMLTRSSQQDDQQAEAT